MPVGDSHIQQWLQVKRKIADRIVVAQFPRLARHLAAVSVRLQETSYRRWHQGRAHAPLSLNRSYYVYALLDPRKPGRYEWACKDRMLVFDYEPFYVGKGTRGRISQHVQAAVSGRDNSDKAKRIRRIIRSGADVIEQKVATGLFECQSLAIEGALIAAIKRRDMGGPLLNLTVGGGTGPTGFRHSDKSKQLMASNRLGQKLSESTKQKLSSIRSSKSAIFYKRVADKARQTRSSWDEAHRRSYHATMQEAALGRWAVRSDAEKHAVIKNMLAASHSKENRAKNRKVLAARNSQTTTCPHCSTRGQSVAMRRWHFDNCKFK